jgi:hypothetical protein
VEDSAVEVHKVGHRAFVGGTGHSWDAIGDLQFRFLVKSGLTPSDVFVDIGCGALRGGARFISYLEPDHYFGFDKYIELIIYGVSVELGAKVYGEKRPRFVVSDSFEFYKLPAKPSFGIAQSLFTHLSSEDIAICLLKLRGVAQFGCRLFATFFETREPVLNPAVSHSHGYFAYTREQMRDFGCRAGWAYRYIGEWEHPRGQMIVEYLAA